MQKFDNANIVLLHHIFVYLALLYIRYIKSKTFLRKSWNMKLGLKMSHFKGK